MAIPQCEPDENKAGEPGGKLEGLLSNKKNTDFFCWEYLWITE